jgi:hypothetical protein
MRELEEHPIGFLESIIEAGLYEHAKGIYDAATRKDEIPSSPIFDLVKQVEFAIVTEDREASDE